MAIVGKRRAHLLDSRMQEMLRQRLLELSGLILITIAGLLGVALHSHSLEDSWWFAATGDPASNMLGNLGAGVSNPLVLILGWAGWCLPVAALAWGARLLFHKGENRALRRIVLLPFAVASVAIFMSSNIPPSSWTHAFGLGGRFGDAALVFLLDVMPLNPDVELLATTVAFGLLASFLVLAALGFTPGELRYLLKLALFAFAVSLASLLRRGRRSARTESPLKAPPPPDAHGGLEAGMFHADDVAAPLETRQDSPAGGARSGRFLTRITGMFRRREAGPGGQAGDGAEAGERGSFLFRGGAIPRLVKASRASATEAPPIRETEPPLLAGTGADADAPLLAGTGADADPPESAACPESPDRTVVLTRKKKRAKPSARAKAEAQPSLFEDGKGKGYELPPLGLLSNPGTIVRQQLSHEALEENARMLETVLDDYGVKGEIVSVRPGPVVTMYELEPAPGLKASRVIGLSDDIARSMSALSARVSTVPGRSVIGIELPNLNREKVLLREILSAGIFGDGKDLLPLALGKDIAGSPMVADLSRMPHLLIAGTTGSGKSVAINTMILSLLYKLTPDECRMIMIDPKMLELSIYDGTPHLLSPVVTDPKKAVVALKWVVAEMEERYRKMSRLGVRNIHGYNARVEDALATGENFSRTVQTGFDRATGEPIIETQEFNPEKMPFIVVVVDEMADLMMVAGKEIEACIQRLAQMARASGIHLIMATQRPSVDVITGTIKANFPTRISFQVTSKVDSRTIIGEMGAEQLLGMGDMLFMAGGGKITRVHGPFVSDEEVEAVVTHQKGFGPPDYVAGVVDGPAEGKESEVDQILGLGGGSGDDALYDQAVAVVAQDRKCSTSYIQRKLAIGYNKAARLVEQMEDDGLVSAANHVGKREILIPEP